MATTFHGGGSQSPTSLSKPLERVFEDAQHTGEILLSSRKLRDYPKLAAKYDLVDTILADVSKNRLNEVPNEVCSYISMEKLNCYHNVIKSVPEAITQLQALTYLNLSRNQLSIIPSFISKIQTLEVLIASHNRLVSLPEEIGVLDKLMELDVSCNEISHLPMQIGDLKSLKSLNVRSNLLQELPVEISKLNLRKLDISGNRISKIPTLFRKIETLEDIILCNNPLILPPAHVCTKGKQHIMKYLQIEAIREDKKRGVLNENEMKRFRKSLPPQQSVSSEEFRNLMESPDKWKRHTVLSSDSGYSTTDSIEKCGWSPQETNSEPQHLIDSNNLAMKATAAACKDQRYMPAGTREARREPPEPPQRINSRLSPEKTPTTAATPPYSLSVSKSPFTSPLIPPTLYPPSPQTPLTPPTPQGPGPGSRMNTGQGLLGTSLEDEFTRELQRQKQDYESKKRLAEQLRIQQEEEEERELRRRAAQRIQDEQRAMLERQREEARVQEETRALLQAEEAKRQEELRQADEARRAEEARMVDDARRQEEARQREEAKQHRVDKVMRPRRHTVDNCLSFYYNTHNSNYSNNAWPPPPPSLINQHEAHSPLSPNHYSGHSPNLNQYSNASPNSSNQFGNQSPSNINQYGQHSQNNYGQHQQNSTLIQSQNQHNSHNQQQSHYGHPSQSQYSSQGHNIQHAASSNTQPNIQHRLTSPGHYEPTPQSPQSPQTAPSRQTNDYSDPNQYGQYDNTRQHGQTQHDIYNGMPLDPYSGYRKPSLSASNSFKEERRPVGGKELYRRTVSDSNQRLPAQNLQNIAPSQSSLTNGPIEELPNMNGSTPNYQSSNSSHNTSFNSQHSAPPHNAMASTNGPTSHRPTTPQESTSRRPKTSERVPLTTSSVSKVAKPLDKHGRISSTSSNTSTRSGVPTPRKTNLNQDEEIRKSQTNLKTISRTGGEQRLKTIQKEAVNNGMNRRSSGSTSSEDDRKRSTPTRSIAGVRSTGLSNTTATTAAASKRSGTGMSSTTTTSTRVSATSRTPAPSRAAPSATTPAASQARRKRQNSTSSTTSVSSTTSKTNVDKSKRSGTVMTSAHVKLLEDYNKEGNLTMRRQHEQQQNSNDQLETLRMTISTRLKRTLPDNLSEALSDGVLLCHLANQIRPRSVASVHVPSPAVPKLTPAKCRRNVENFIEACKKIGVSKDQICQSSDILEEKGILRVAANVAALVAIATHPAIATHARHAPASNV